MSKITAQGAQGSSSKREPTRRITRASASASRNQVKDTVPASKAVTQPQSQCSRKQEGLNESIRKDRESKPASKSKFKI